MKIGIDIRPLEGATYGGVAEYIKNLLPKMFEVAPDGYEFHIFCNSHKHKADLGLFKHNNVVIHEFNYPSKLFNFLCQYLNMPKIDKMIGGVDVFFSPHFFPAPVSSSCPKVTTFHDLSFQAFPEFFDLRRRLWHKTVRPKKQALSSSAIIAVSNSTKEDVESMYNIPPENINVIYSGVATSSGERNKWSNIKRKYNIPNKYILSLNTIEPRKNMSAVVRAFNMLAGEEDLLDLGLVVAGNFGWSYKEFLKEVNASEYKERITITGPVAEKDKPQIYKNASVFIYPSLYEGFGFPPLEAMLRGVPSIVSFSTSLPEVTGGGALLVDPTRPVDIATGIREVLRDDRLADKLSATGKEQASKFTWDRTARETLDILTKSARRA